MSGSTPENGAGDPTKRPAADRRSVYRPYTSDADAHAAPSASSQADAMGATVIAYLITGPLMFGGLGWLLARWTDITVFIPIGLLVGMALSLYTIWLRYGRT